MKTIFAWSLLLTVAGLSIGCASRPVDLSETGAVQVEKGSSKLVQIPWVVVTQEENGMVVSGAVRRWPSNHSVIAGHVDVTVLDESGQVLTKLITPYTPSRIPLKGTQSSSFRAKINQRVQPGLVVRVAHDTRTEKACSALDVRTEPEL